MVYVDTSGKWRVRSSRANRYHTVFVCAKSVMKLTIPHRKHSHFPLVYMKLLVNVCNHICLFQNEYYSLGVSEKTIDDLDRNTRAIMTDDNISPPHWDIIVKHVVLLNVCTSPSICDPEITIFEDDIGVVPDLAVFPPPGCFCIRHRNKIDRIDHKVDAQNDDGVF